MLLPLSDRSAGAGPDALSATISNAEPSLSSEKAALVFNLSLRCPLKCAHCCYSSDMSFEEKLPMDAVLAAIAEAAASSAFDAVHFVGGDPFLYQYMMTAAAEAARDAGLAAKATTSAF